MEIRNKATGEIISQRQYLELNPGVNLPRIWTAETLNAIGYDMVIPLAPEGLPSSSTKEWYRDGVKQDANGNWVYNWIERNIYNDIPGGATQAEQKAEHLAREERALAEGARTMRNDRLRLSDWVVLKAQENGEPVPEAWKDYRKALRDVPAQAGFPRNILWPNIPS